MATDMDIDMDLDLGPIEDDAMFETPAVGSLYVWTVTAFHMLYHHNLANKCAAVANRYRAPTGGDDRRDVCSSIRP